MILGLRQNQIAWRINGLLDGDPKKLQRHPSGVVSRQASREPGYEPSEQIVDTEKATSYRRFPK